MAQVGTLLNRLVTASISAAEVAANTDFVAVNLQNIGGAIMYIDSIDVVIAADAADFANLINIQAEILKNVTLNPNVSLASQVGNGNSIPLWRGRSPVPTNRSFSKEFQNGGFKLIPDSAYTIFVFASFSAALALPTTTTLSVVGRYEDELSSKSQMYGKPR